LTAFSNFFAWSEIYIILCLCFQKVLFFIIIRASEHLYFISKINSIFIHRDNFFKFTGHSTNGALLPNPSPCIYWYVYCTLRQCCLKTKTLGERSKHTQEIFICIYRIYCKSLGIQSRYVSLTEFFVQRSPGVLFSFFPQLRRVYSTLVQILHLCCRF
jgi:hypothetical protein